MFLEMHFRSEELKRETQVNILIPDSGNKNGAPYKTLWLLHGLLDDCTGWMRYTSIERYANEYGIAVVMPGVDRSWYTDTAYGANYFSFITRELPELYFSTFSQMSRKREDNILAGLSMGGYGAIKAALTYPEQYGAAVSLSGALDIPRHGAACSIDEWRSIFGYELNSPSELEGGKHDLFTLAKRIKDEGKEIPKLYIWCGTKDGLLHANRSFDRHLTELGIAHEYEESQGDHSWKWWDLHVQNGLSWVLRGQL
jgi:S-formylglutathione hydrolase FrmB